MTVNAIKVKMTPSHPGSFNREHEAIPKEQQRPNRSTQQPASAEPLQQGAREPRRLDTRPEASPVCPPECAARKCLLPPAPPTA